MNPPLKTTIVVFLLTSTKIHIIIKIFFFIFSCYIAIKFAKLECNLTLTITRFLVHTNPNFIHFGASNIIIGVYFLEFNLRGKFIFEIKILETHIHMVSKRIFWGLTGLANSIMVAKRGGLLEFGYRTMVEKPNSLTKPGLAAYLNIIINAKVSQDSQLTFSYLCN